MRLVRPKGKMIHNDHFRWNYCGRNLIILQKKKQKILAMVVEGHLFLTWDEKLCLRVQKKKLYRYMYRSKNNWSQSLNRMPWLTFRILSRSVLQQDVKVFRHWPFRWHFDGPCLKPVNMLEVSESHRRSLCSLPLSLCPLTWQTSGKHLGGSSVVSR